MKHNARRGNERPLAATARSMAHASPSTTAWRGAATRPAGKGGRGRKRGEGRATGGAREPPRRLQPRPPARPPAGAPTSGDSLTLSTACSIVALFDSWKGAAGSGGRVCGGQARGRGERGRSRPPPPPRRMPATLHRICAAEGTGKGRGARLAGGLGRVDHRDPGEGTRVLGQPRLPNPHVRRRRRQLRGGWGGGGGEEGRRGAGRIFRRRGRWRGEPAWGGRETGSAGGLWHGSAAAAGAAPCAE